MVRCKVCAAEVTTDVCPYCGAKVLKDVSKVKATKEKGEKIEAPKEKPKDAKPLDILNQIDQAKAILVEQSRYSVVKVYAEFRPMFSTGSGFIVSGDYIVTNAHVVLKENSNRLSLFIEYADDLKLDTLKKAYAEVLYVSKEDDIAILKPERHIPSIIPRLKLCDTLTKQGEAVFTIGNPLHYRFTYIEGSVANPEYNKKNASKYSYLQTTLTLNHGNSGGPVFNMRGEVVGMATFSELIKQEDSLEDQVIRGYGFCVSAKAIHDAISSLK